MLLLVLLQPHSVYSWEVPFQPLAQLPGWPLRAYCIMERVGKKQRKPCYRQAWVTLCRWIPETYMTPHLSSEAPSLLQGQLQEEEERLVVLKSILGLYGIHCRK